ncbi:MAG: signal peptidase II [Deltaproteobacteria bacterium]|nr:signal peptidase II [Deltaproteobacteria bacterium]
MKGKYVWLATSVVLVTGLDQWTKLLAVEKLKSGRGVDVIKGCFQLRYVENPGAAWGFLAGANEAFRAPFFVAVSLLAIAFILYFYRKVESDQKVMLVSLSMILGGAVGNFIDRLRHNYVVDFIDWYWKDWHWPTFNIADSAISLGVVLMVWTMLFGEEERKTVESEKLKAESRTEGQPPAQ